MSRKKKIYKKKGKIIKDLTKNIFKILNKDSSKYYNYKQISAKLGVSDTDGKTQILQKLVELTGSKKIKEIDSKQIFQSDDEIGWFFKGIKEIQDLINEYNINHK